MTMSRANHFVPQLHRSSFAATRVRIRQKCYRTCMKRHYTTDDIQDVPDFGCYNVVLPPEPFVFGISHFAPRFMQGNIAKPPYALNRPQKDDPFNGDPYDGDGRIQLGSEEEARLRRTATLAKEVREYAGCLVKPGITTNEIDEIVHGFILSQKAYPSPLHYAGFPRSCCTSVNNIIVHGIPDDRPLEDGDIVNIDITVYREGFHGDTSRTFLVGNVDLLGQHLVELTNRALAAGIATCGPGKHFRDIGRAIHNIVADDKPHENTTAFKHEAYDPGAWKCCVSPQFTGHGIGHVFHRPPWILHHLNDEPGEMLSGHCFTIEPNLIQGINSRGWTWPDGWTVSTENCARSAQAEDMVLITDTGAEILT